MNDNSLITVSSLKKFKESFDSKLTNLTFKTFSISDNPLNISIEYTPCIISIIGGSNSNTLYSTIYLYTSGSYLYSIIVNNNARIYVNLIKYSDFKVEISFSGLLSKSGIYTITTNADSELISEGLSLITPTYYNTYESDSTTPETVDVLLELGFKSNMSCSRSGNIITITGATKDQIRIYSSSDIKVNEDSNPLTVKFDSDNFKIVSIGNDNIYLS